MLILLPPSETKADGGRGGALDLAALSLPKLTPIRELLVHTVTALAADPTASRIALGLGTTAASDAEIARNASLWSAPTMPALTRYTGVLYDALNAQTFTKAQHDKAAARVAIGSALFGTVRARDPIPAYRLSGGSKLPGITTLSALWREELPAAIIAEAEGGLVVDLRSGIYQQLGRVPNAVTATVVTEAADGSRSVVSHFNKHHKGLLARTLALSRAEPHDLDGVARVAKRAGMRVEHSGHHELTIVTI